MAVINCPNCGAPVRHLTGGDICEYCGSSFPLSYLLRMEIEYGEH